MHREDYTVAIICALPIELAAARAILSKTHEELPSLPFDDNIYTLGKIAKHNVVITCLPAGSIGTVSAAVLATRLQSSFPAIKIGLMLGIGGGVPSRKHDVRLGDVVVSQPSGQSGGVVQYDFGKTVKSGKFEPTGQLNRPPAVLLKAVAKLRSDHLLKGHELKQTLASITSKYPRQFVHPGSKNDELFESEYDHPSDDPDCLHCDRSRVVARASRPDDGPVIHYGLIASGNQVMKHGPTRDELGQRLDILCFEMEAAGLMDSFPCAVVRGLCDYSDSHKNKAWQPYAAAVAAAYVRELLEVIPASQVAETQSATQTFQRYDEIALYRPPSTSSSLSLRDAWDVQSSSDPAQWSVLVSRISNYNRDKVHRRLRKRRLEKTTDWFLQHPLLQQWLRDSAHSSLWCCGGIGSGKTILSTKLVDYLQDKADRPLIFFYCETSDSKTLQSRCLFMSLIQQILKYIADQHQDCPLEIKSKINHHFNPTGPLPDLEDLVHIFSILYEHVSNAIYIIDGLDEMETEDASETLKALQELLQTPSTQKLFIASRDEIGIQVRPVLSLTLQISPPSTQSDLQLFIEHEVSRRMKQERPLTENEELLSQIKERLSENARGMFLWVQLQIDALWLDCFCDQDIILALADLPRDLDATYDRCVNRIPATTVDIAAKVLRWLACASRPLHMPELQEAVSFSLADTEWSSERKISPSLLISSCANLVTLDKKDYVVRLTHPSVKQYLCGLRSGASSMFRLDLDAAELQCGEECVNYLSFSDFQLQLQKSASASSKISVPAPKTVMSTLPFGKQFGIFSKAWLQKSTPNQTEIRITRTTSSSSEAPNETRYALLNYARQNWAAHTKSITRESTMWADFETLALQPNSSWKLHPWSSSGDSQVSHLHGLLSWASRERHLPLLQVLVKGSHHQKLREFCNIPLVHDGLPALHVAARLGFLDVLHILLEFCNVNVRDQDLRTPLHYCAEKNHLIPANRLLEYRKDLETSAISKSGETPLGLAAELGFSNMVSLLLSYGADLVPGDRLAMNPLVLAASNGHTAVLQLLLEKISKTQMKALRRLALSQETEKRHEDIVPLVLELSQPKAGPSSGFQPHIHLLFDAASNGDESMVKLFFMDKSKWNLDIASYAANSALTRAAKHGHHKIVELLLAQPDIDINRLRIDSKTSLALAAEAGHAEVVKLLLARDDVEAEPQDNEKNTPLHHAAKNGHEAVVELLLARSDIDSNFRNSLKSTPLHYAAEHGHEAVVKLLLARGDIKPNLQHSYNKAPLHHAADNGHEAVVKLLLAQKDVRPNIQDSHSSTPLHHAAENGHEVVVELLLARADIKPNLQDSYIKSALYHAAGNGHEAIVRLLLARADVYPNSYGKNVDSPLHIAAANGHEMVVRLLLARHDINPNAQGKSVDTPLHVAARSGREAVVRLLLARGDVDPNSRDYFRRTPLSTAAKEGRESIVSLLLTRKDVQVDMANLGQYKPSLNLVSRECYENILRLVETRGAVE